MRAKFSVKCEGTRVWIEYRFGGIVDVIDYFHTLDEAERMVSYLNG